MNRPFGTRAGAILSALLCTAAGLAAGPATRPATAPADPALWNRLMEIDARAAKIKSLSADFEQKKYTALLKKPLISSGTIRVKGSTMRWDGQKPEPSVLLITDKEVRVYYPVQKTVEVYAIEQRMGEVAASPLPRLAVLKEHFSFEQVPVKAMDDSADAAKEKQFLALKLLPTADSLREHLQEVRVLLDVTTGYIVKFEMTDADGDRTLIGFHNVKVNTDVGDLALAVPPGTKTTRPLEGLEGGAGRAPSSPRTGQPR